VKSVLGGFDSGRAGHRRIAQAVVDARSDSGLELGLQHRECSHKAIIFRSHLTLGSL